MKVHGNAALGPAGRLALVQAIESGMDVEGGSPPPSTWRRPQPTAGGIAGAMRARRIAGAAAGFATALAAPPPAKATLSGRGGADPARPPGDRSNLSPDVARLLKEQGMTRYRVRDIGPLSALVRRSWRRLRRSSESC
jgi:hypothetical protein